MANSFLDPVLGWLLYLDPAIALILISFIISLLITLALKFFTNQTLMKDLREEMKELQKEMKEHKNNPKKLAKINSLFMETNMKYMSHSMKPTLYTFLPIIFIFGWLNSHMGYYPLLPGEAFKVTAEFQEDASGFIIINVPQGIEVLDSQEKEIVRGKVDWQLRGLEGEYDITFHYQNKTYTKDVIITSQRAYAPVEQNYRKRFLFFSTSDQDGLSKVILGNKKVLPFSTIPLLKDIPWIKEWGWFGAYILFSIFFSMGLRRILKIY